MTDLMRLRIATTVAAAAGTLTLGLQGQLPVWAAVLGVLAEAAAAWLPVQFASPRATGIRRAVARTMLLTVGLLGALALLVVRLQAGLSDTSNIAAQVGSTIALPLVGVLLAQIASGDSVRELRVVLVAALLCGLLSLGTAPPGGAHDLVSAFGMCLLVGWVAAATGLWLLPRCGLQEQVGPHALLPGRSRGGLHQLVAIVVGGVLVGVAALTYLPHPSGWHPDGTGTGSGATGPSSPLESQGSGAGAAPRGPDNYLSPQLDLSSRGDLSAQELVSVPADSPDLWAGSTLTAYTGRYWQSGVSGPLGFVLPVDGAGDYDLRRGARTGDAPPAADRADSVTLLDPLSALPLIAPGMPVSARLDGKLMRFIGTTLLPRFNPGASSYVVRSNTGLVDLVTDADTSLPDSLPQRVRDLAVRLTSNAPTPEAKSAAIESYLRAHERYRLDSPVPGEGKDAVDDFLFVSHLGFCEHFASAEAVLLRAVGVPARVVTGFTSGRDAGDRRIFRGSDAHAWVAVGVGDGRWVWADPTAGATLAPDLPSLADRLRSALRRSAAVLVAGLAVLVGLVLMLVVLHRTRPGRERRRRIARATPAERLLLTFAELDKALPKVRLPRSPGQSLHELSAAVQTRWPGGLTDTAATAEAFAAVERALYDDRPVSDDEACRAAATLAALTTLAQETPTPRGFRP